MTGEPDDALSKLNPATLAALGILAYVTETLAHEAIGHGGTCLLSGGKFLLLAPLYMRCSDVTLPMVAAGPGMNVLAGAFFLAALRAGGKLSGTVRYFLWLGVVFNWLVAAGYLLVGAIALFGDWTALFAWVKPSWAWRVPAAALALYLYRSVIVLAGRELVKLNGVGVRSWAEYFRLILVPTSAAALVAFGAEVYGQGARWLWLGLAFGCTLFIGLSLVAIGPAKSRGEDRLVVPFNPLLVAIAVLAGIGFVLVIGPGVNLSTL